MRKSKNAKTYFQACPQPVLILIVQSVDTVQPFNRPRLIIGHRKMGTLRDLSLLPSFSHFTLRVDGYRQMTVFWGVMTVYLPSLGTPKGEDCTLRPLVFYQLIPLGHSCSAI